MSRFIASFLVILASGLLTFSGCNDGDINCLTNTGPIITQVRSVGNFDSISLTDHVNVILQQDSVNIVEVEAGKNVIDGIVTETEGRVLYIGNTNKCNWLRDYNKPLNVYVHVRNLLHINYNASGNVTAKDTLRSDSLKVEVWGGCGTIDLTLRIPLGFFTLQLGTATMILHGYCSITSIYSRDYGLIQGKDLRAGYNFVKNAGSNDCYVNAWQCLDATIESIGNIYYAGKPDSLSLHINGTGSVIPL